MSGFSLSQAAYDWALKHLELEGDTDFFPVPFEVAALRFNWDNIKADLARLDLTNHNWRVGRRFTVPKGKLSFRAATQLDPMDSLILAAIVKQYGAKIEAKRIPKEQGVVFSYRFDPLSDGRLYGINSLWHDYWEASKKNASEGGCSHVVLTDITDYYNQIYHHVLGNQLRRAGWPDWLVRAVEGGLLGTLTQGVSRGIPVGPHAVHLLAEAALIPIDDALLGRGLSFCRYADDFHFYCASEEDAYSILFDFAEVLDLQQRLTVQNRKTRIMHVSEFIRLCDSMLIERPKNDAEAELLKTLDDVEVEGPYDLVSSAELDEKGGGGATPDKLSELIDLYIHPQGELVEGEGYEQGFSPDFSRLGWLLRRLRQLGAPGAVDYLLDHIDQVLPVLGDVARYITRASKFYEGDNLKCGQRILTALSNPVVSRSEYVQMVLTHLFSSVPEFNHVNSLTAKYRSVPNSVRREIFLAVRKAGGGSWARQRKMDFQHGDPWLKRAVLAASSTFPGDEATHWIRQIRKDLTPLDQIVLRWAFNDHNLKVGHFGL